MNRIRADVLRSSLRGFLCRAIGLWPEAAIIVLGLWFRYQYAAFSHMLVDEFIDALALKGIAQHGIPLFESGALRQRGWVYLYSAVPFVFAFGFTKLAMRLPSLFYEAALMGLVACFGRREWHRLAGLGAATVVALLPTLIRYNSRARFYAPFVLFTLLSLWFALRSIRRPQSRSAHLGFAVSFGLAVMSHEEAILLYPAIVGLQMLWGRGRYWRERTAWAAHVGIGLIIAFRGGLEFVANLTAPALLGVEAKPYFELLESVAEKWKVYQQLYFAPGRWPLPVLAAVGLGAELFSLWHNPDEANRRVAQALSFLVFPPLSVLLFFVFVAGSEWRETRYMVFAEPLLALSAAAGVWLTIRNISRYAHRAVHLLLVGFTVLAGVILWPGAKWAAAFHNRNYASAFRYVAEHRQPDDVVVTPLIYACAFIMPNGCDYYMRQIGYEPYVIVRGGRLVDRWTGAPLLHRPEALERLVKTTPRVWAVADGHRFGARYRDTFQRILLEQFRVVAEFEGGVRVALAEGWQEPPPYTVERPLALPVGPFTLEQVERTELLEHGQQRQLALVLHWSLPEDFPTNLNTSVKLVSSEGQNITQADGPPANGLVGTAEEPRLPLFDVKTLTLPPDLPPGLYRLEVALYEPATLTPHSPSVPFEWLWVGPPPPPPPHPRQVTWQNGLVLLGHDGLPERLVPGQPLPVRLVWTTRRALAEELTASVQLIGPDGQLVAQDDHPPLRGFYPTSRWLPNETVVPDTYTLALPEELPAGDYRLVVLWYEAQTLRRVPLADGGDLFELGRWEVD